MSIGLLVACLQPPRRCEPSAADEWWAQQVVCVTIDEVPAMEQETAHVHYYALANGLAPKILKVTRHPLSGQPDHLVGKYLDQKIAAYTEQRQHFWAFQPESWMTYHVSTIFEVDCPPKEKLFILIERVDDKLEIMMGVGSVSRSFMLEIRATGKCRKSDRCFQQPRQLVAPRVTVKRLFEWLGHNLSRRWQPYHILHSNCQHVAEELQSYVRNPNSTKLPTAILDDDLVSTQTFCTDAAAMGMTPVGARGSAGYRSNSFNSGGIPTRVGSFGTKAPSRCGSFDGSVGLKSCSFSVHPENPPPYYMPAAGYAMGGSYSMPQQLQIHPSHRPRQFTPEEEEDNCVVQ